MQPFSSGDNWSPFHFCFQAAFHSVPKRIKNYMDFLHQIAKKASSWSKWRFFFLQPNLIHRLQDNNQGGDSVNLRLVPIIGVLCSEYFLMNGIYY